MNPRSEPEGYPPSAEEREAARRERNERIPFDWRIVKVDQTRYCEDWAKECHVTSCGVYYLYDANRHVHLCEFTPSNELWPIAAWVEFATEQAQEADEGESELDLLNSEEACSYMYVRDVERLPSKPIDWAPDREEGEDCETYYMRACEEFREHYQGNPPGWRMQESEPWIQ